MRTSIRIANGRVRCASRTAGLAAAVAAMLAAPLVAALPASASVTVTSHFVWTADSANTSGDSAFIVNGATDNEPKDLLFVTANFNATGICGCIYETAPIGVWYDSANDEWAVLREDGSAMPTNESFNVLAVPKANSSVFVQTANASNITGDYTLIDSSATNGQPDAQLQVTQNWNPNGKGGTYNPHQIGVFYNTTAAKWAVFNEDGSAMTVGAAFNVMVGQKPSNGGKSSVLTTTSSNQDGDTTLISNHETTGNPNNVTFATQNWNPGGTGGTYNDVQTGVWYTGTREGVFNENQATVPLNASFNILVFSS